MDIFTNIFGICMAIVLSILIFIAGLILIGIIALIIISIVISIYDKISDISIKRYIKKKK